MKTTRTMSADVVVLGGGPAGENVAGTAARHGLSVVLVEQQLVGGECSYWGCMPSKALLRPTEVLAATRRVPAAAAAITGEVDVVAALRGRDLFAARWDDGSQVSWLDERDIALVRGHGRIVGERTVEVTTDDGSVRRIVASRAVVIATGSSAAWPPIPGLREVGALDNRGITTLDRVPESLLVIGGGVIGVEMAQAWRRLGTPEVHVVEVNDRLIANEEHTASDELARALRAEGIELHLGVGVSATVRSDDGIDVSLSNAKTLTVGDVLVATGRRPNSADIGLDAVGLRPGEWLATDDQLRVVGVHWLYAVGDVNGRALLTHMGKYQARIAGEVIAGGDGEAWADRHAVTRVVFTDPQIAAVGHTESSAIEAGLDVRVVDYEAGLVSETALLGRGYSGTCRLVLDGDRIVGATFVGPGAAELAHGAAIAIAGAVPIEQLWHAVPPFPTTSEVWLRLLEELLEQTPLEQPHLVGA